MSTAQLLPGAVSDGEFESRKVRPQVRIELKSAPFGAHEHPAACVRQVGPFFCHMRRPHIPVAVRARRDPAPERRALGEGFAHLELHKTRERFVVRGGLAGSSSSLGSHRVQSPNTSDVRELRAAYSPTSFRVYARTAWYAETHRQIRCQRDQQREVVLGLLILVVPHDAQRKIARSGGCLIPNNTGLRGQFSLVGLVILRQVKIFVCVC